MIKYTSGISTFCCKCSKDSSNSANFRLATGIPNKQGKSVGFRRTGQITLPYPFDFPLISFLLRLKYPHSCRPVSN